ncbi:unnamed protein product [Ectocarpus sp. 12 AP-2014]
MGLPIRGGFCAGGLTAFVPAVPPVPRLVSRRSISQCGGRMPRDLQALSAAAVEQGDDHEQQNQVEDIPNLFRVTPVPTYEEMLVWAEETDRRIATGQLPPLGSRRPPSGDGAVTVTAAEQHGAGASLLSDQEQAQMATLSELLSKRRRQSPPLSDEEESALRAAMAGLSASVENDTDAKAIDVAADTSSGPDTSDGDITAAGHVAEAEDIIPNHIYGSRQVRDHVYLYAWSLMKDRQDAAEREAGQRAGES